MARSDSDDSVWATLSRLAVDPIGQIVLRWNWKAALLSSLWRSLIFAAVAARGGWRAAAGAGTAEFLLQAAAAGLSGAVMQAFCRVRPAWQGIAAAGTLVLCIQHPLEFVLHWMRGTPHVRSGVLISMGCSLASVVVNIGLMRRGLLIVGADAQSLRGDLRRACALPVGESR